MADETTDPPEAPPEYSIEDFITAYTKKAWTENGVAILAHNGDGITITVPEGISKLIVRQKTTETRITRVKGPFGNMIGGEARENIAHADVIHTIAAGTPQGGINPLDTAGSGSRTFVNNAEKTETVDIYGAKKEIVHDWNHFFSLERAEDSEGNQLKLKKATPPPPPGDKDKPAGFDPWPWIIGGFVILIIAAVVYFFFLKGRTIGGHTFGAPPQGPAQAPGGPVVVMAGSPAPAPIQAAQGPPGPSGGPPGVNML